MSAGQDALPPEIYAKLMTFCREENGEFRITDKEGLLRFIAEFGEQHPSLLSLVKVNAQALGELYEKTGEVPPGVKLIGKTRENDKITRLQVLHGPIPPRS